MHYRSPQSPGIEISAGSFTAAEIIRLTQLADIVGVQGDIIYHNGAAWVALGAGTSGHFLKTQGAGANPLWAAASGLSTLTVGTTTITSGATTRILYDNAGVLGEYVISGTGNVAMTNTPILVTPTIGVAKATRIGLNNVANIGNAYIEGKTLTASGIQGLQLEADNAANIQFSTYLTGDGFTRFSFLADGAMKWGGGTLVADTNLYRSAADTLTTDDKFVALGGLKITNSSTSGYVWTATDTIGNGSWQVSSVPSTRNINTTAPLSGGGDLSADRTLTTSMATNKLIGRGTAGTGVMEEITLGTNLSFSGTTLNAAGGSGTASADYTTNFMFMGA